MLIVGTDYVVRISNILIGREVSFSFKIQAEEIKLAGRNYDYDEFINTTKSAVLDIEALFDPDQSMNLNQIFDFINFSTLVDVQLDDLKSTTNNFYFKARVTNFEITSNVDEFVRFRATLRVSGAIERAEAYYLIDTDGFFVVQTNNVSKIIIVNN